MVRSRSRSRGRQVSFKIDKSRTGLKHMTESKYILLHLNLLKLLLQGERLFVGNISLLSLLHGHQKGRGKRLLVRKHRIENLAWKRVLRVVDVRGDVRKSYLTGQTPGPEIGLSNGIKKRKQDLTRRLKGGLDHVAA